MGGIYLTALKNLKPGVTEFVIHPGYDDDELRAATRERSTWGSAWRQRDYDFFTSDQYREILAQQKIKLITWGTGPRCQTKMISVVWQVVSRRRESVMLYER